MIPRGASRIAAIGLAGLVLAGTALLVGPPMGLFSGSRPAITGFSGGRFTDGDSRPNWVSSTTSRADAIHHVDPIAFRGDPGRAWAGLESAIAAMPRATIVARSPGYLRAEFASKALGFVDDAEFALDATANLIHVKSAARLGIRDFSVNRGRVEAIRAQFERTGN